MVLSFTQIADIALLGPFLRHIVDARGWMAVEQSGIGMKILLEGVRCLKNGKRMNNCLKLQMCS
ncbi:MAG: hypothetical protein GF363_13570 [Chitinivibrionales bacterium]|nr:hypothetical protein [Chitinivibrionales bacterium]